MKKYVLTVISWAQSISYWRISISVIYFTGASFWEIITFIKIMFNIWSPGIFLLASVIIILARFVSLFSTITDYNGLLLAISQGCKIVMSVTINITLSFIFSAFRLIGAAIFCLHVSSFRYTIYIKNLR